MDNDVYLKHKEKQKIDRSAGSIYNSWRSKVHTEKGRKIGFPESWAVFDNFINEMSDGWERYKLLVRIDASLPYSKENCEWVDKGYEQKSKLIKFEHNNEIKTIVEWCELYDLNYSGVINRYHKHKEYTSDEVLFGKKRKKKKDLLNIDELNTQEIRNKASKMISSYKVKDKKRGYSTDIDIDFMVDIFNKKCEYCGDNKHIGLDRIDNSIGHLKYNCVPCCVTCNTARNDNFTYEEMKLIGLTIKSIKEKRNESK